MVAGSFALEHQIAANEVNPRIEKQQRFDQPLNEITEHVVTPKVRALVFDDALEIGRRKLPEQFLG